MNLEDFVKVSKTKQSGAAGSDKVKEEKPDHGQMEEPRRDMDQGINRNSVLTVTAIYVSKKNNKRTFTDTGFHDCRVGLVKENEFFF